MDKIKIWSLVRALMAQDADAGDVDPNGRRAITAWYLSAREAADTELVDEIDEYGIEPLADEWERQIEERRGE